METSRSRNGIEQSDINEILAYVQIAELHDAPLPLADALNLTSLQLSEEDLVEAWKRTGLLSSEYPLFSGQIVSRRMLTEQGADGLRRKIETGRRRVEKNMLVAKHVSRIFAEESVKMFAVSGGNSYNFARGGDDIDLFCVTRTDALWLFMLKALVVVRFYEFFRKDLPRLCFSYVLDEANARKQFGSPKDRLFARDALNLKVMAGRGFYASLIGDAKWMHDWFPRIYSMTARHSVAEPSTAKSSPVDRIVNLLLYRMMGPYLRLKSVLDNAKNGRRGKQQFVNHLRLGEGMILHESRKYRDLRGIYEFENDVGSASSDGASPSPPS